MENKKRYGQYYTTEWSIILDRMDPPDGYKIEPFIGNGDLLKFCDFDEMYDIDPKIECEKRDTLLDPPDYANKYVITNPPYLARNKSKDKTIFDKYNVNDLYKCFIKSIINVGLLGGIIIIPVSFLSSIRNMEIELRRQFILEFNIRRVNLFEYQVFSDTTTPICAIQFESRELNENNNIYHLPIHIYKENRNTPEYMNVKLDEENNYTIGGKIYNLTGPYNIKRLCEGDTANNNLLINCIDSSNNFISMKLVGDEDIYYDCTKNRSARTYVSFSIEPQISITLQRLTVKVFNNLLNKLRNKYHSMFLNSYRETSRKRISFTLAKNLLNYSIMRAKKLLENYKLISSSTSMSSSTSPN